MECPFQVGDKVVCVYDGIDYLGKETTLKKGSVYLVKRVVPCGDNIGRVVSGASSWHVTGAYAAWRFRPVASRSTDKCGRNTRGSISRSMV